ncbi:Smr/MutS family protein [Thermaurantiacus tibetensis]|uniref:Smr/MutS family protein n=1 Tax=Thermaurantiacus tibetensis TaxID=2759035 RepID=UPI001890AC50|nr:Smr/MutS family protein [Thermaurantiacus tibetensis]
MSRRLTAEELALWRQVAATVRAWKPLPEVLDPPEPRPPARPDRAGVGARKARAGPAGLAPARPQRPTETLDASWDRKLASGKARPDRVIDLHGHTREEARLRLERTVRAAADRGERLLLVITGKGGTPGPAPADLMGDRPGRGAIRAELPRWLGAPELSARIAAVRQAPGRQGGPGAVWLVLRRARARSDAGGR